MGPALLAIALLVTAAKPKPPPVKDAGVALEDEPPLEIVEPKRPFKAPRLTVPGTLDETDVPDKVNALGIPVRLRAVRSSKDIPTLMEHFRRSFEEDGLYIPDDSKLVNPSPLPHVTAFNGDNDISYSVLFQANPDGTTTVLVGTAFLHARKEPTTGASFAPTPPGARRVLVSETETGATLSYAVANVTPSKVIEFYVEELGKAGFRQTTTTEFERDGEILSIHPRQKGNETTVVIVRSRVAGR